MRRVAFYFIFIEELQRDPKKNDKDPEQHHMDSQSFSVEVSVYTQYQGVVQISEAYRYMVIELRHKYETVRKLY